MLISSPLGAALQGVTQSGEVGSERLLVQRVSSSELFQKSPRLREFLIYVADCTLESRLSEVREQIIAERVFGRRPDAGAQDSIVRAEARNLRKRLELYFDTEGRDEPVTITMPKGGYSLAFVPRAIDEKSPGLESEVVERIQPAQLEHPSNAAVYRRLCIVFGVIATLSIASAVYWFDQNRSLRSSLAISTPIFPFSAIFSHDDHALIVTSDVGLLEISSLLHRPVSLDEYIARSYPGVTGTNPPDLLRNWNIYEFTDGREMNVAGLICKTNLQFMPQILLRSGHAVELEDLKNHNAVLIGSPISNPWAQLYEEHLNFLCERPHDGLIVFKRKDARPNQQNEFPNEDDIKNHRTYARIAFIPKRYGAGATLLIAGTTAQSTQAAGEFVTDPVAFPRALGAAGINPAGPPRFFEILVRSNNFVAGAISTEVVTFLSSSPAQH